MAWLDGEKLRPLIGEVGEVKARCEPVLIVSIGRLLGEAGAEDGGLEVVFLRAELAAT